MMRLIDYPSPFASVEEWKTFLADLKRIRDPEPDVRRAIERAEQEISRRDSRRPAK